MDHWAADRYDKAQAVVNQLLRDLIGQQNQTKEFLDHKLQHFSGGSSGKFTAWIKRFEMAIDMAYVVETEEHREMFKFYLLGDYLRDEALNLYKGAGHALGSKITFQDAVQYILIRIDTPVNQLRANVAWLKYYRDSMSFSKHFDAFIVNTIATCGLPEELIMSHVMEFAIKRDASFATDRAIQTLMKIEFLYTLPRRIAEQMEDSVNAMTLLEIRDRAEELLFRDKERRHRLQPRNEERKIGGRDNISSSSSLYKQGFKEGKVHNVTPLVESGTLKKEKDISDTSLNQVSFGGPVLSHIFLNYSLNNNRKASTKLWPLLFFYLLIPCIWNFSNILDCDDTMKKQAGFDTLIEMLEKANVLTQTTTDTLREYWNREEYDAAKEMVRQILQSVPDKLLPDNIDKTDLPNITPQVDQSDIGRTELFDTTFSVLRNEINEKSLRETTRSIKQDILDYKLPTVNQLSPPSTTNNSTMLSKLQSFAGCNFNRAKELIYREQERRTRQERPQKEENSTSWVPRDKKYSSQQFRQQRNGNYQEKVNHIIPLAAEMNSHQTSPDEIEHPTQISFVEPHIPRILYTTTLESPNYHVLGWKLLLIFCVILGGGSMQQWHLESRNVYTQNEKSCIQSLELVAVSAHYVLLLRESPVLLLKLPGISHKCNHSMSEFSQVYNVQLEKPIWARHSINEKVFDNMPHYPNDMTPKVRGIAGQLLLFKAGLIVSDLTDIGTFRLITYSLVQQFIAPSFHKACAESVRLFKAIQHTSNSTEKIRILLDRNDVRALMQGSTFQVTRCKPVVPQAIFSDYKYNNICYTRIPILIQNQLKFMDNDGYLHEHAMGHPCVQVSMDKIERTLQPE
uniref:Uncharacterized protein n=1 Tax=Strongyloides stercoralis TaxID=6248 RepID=A0AAF5I4C0_STRER